MLLMILMLMRFIYGQMTRYAEYAAEVYIDAAMFWRPPAHAAFHWLTPHVSNLFHFIHAHYMIFVFIRFHFTSR